MDTDIFSNLYEISKHTRFPDSNGSKNTRNYLTNFLDSCNLPYEYSYSKMPNWSLKGMPIVEVTSPERYQFKALPAIFSLPTDGYVEGQLIASDKIKMLDAFDWDKYAIKCNDIDVAYIISTDYGAMMQPLPFDELNLPCVIVDTTENIKIKNWLNNNELITVRLSNPSLISGELETTSIFSTTSYSEKVPFICAHYDTVYDNYGAHDNASGVSILMELIKKSNSTFKFAFFDGEECNKVGSKAFVNRLKTRNELEAISYVLELDSVGVGDEIGFLASKKTYKSLKKISFDTLGLENHKINISQQTKIAFCDVWPFMSEGIPVIRMLTRGRNSNQIMHSPDDTIDKIEKDTLVNVYNIVEFLLQNLHI